MGAAFFSVEPRPGRDGGNGPRTGSGSRLRQVHRWTSIVFTLAVAANFVAMSQGIVPALITYSPLLPLLILMLIELCMFARASASKPRRLAQATSES